MKIEELPDGLSGAGKFDLAIVGLGYESRGTYCFQTLNIDATRGIALTFGYGETLSFSKNRSFFIEKGFEILSGNSDQAKADIQERIRAAQKLSKDPIKIFLDISVMSRQMMAHVLLALLESGKERELEVYSTYAPSEFIDPPEPTPLRRSEPVCSEFSGWTNKPDAPLNALIGLGYESGLAIGALQFLDPAKVWAFFPVGSDPRYLNAVHKINQPIFDHFTVVNVEYDLSDPHRLKRRIEELSRNLMPRSRLVFIPFGPKLFGWISMLVALELGMVDLSVWRFSAQEATPAIERVASGTIIEFNFRLFF